MLNSIYSLLKSGHLIFCVCICFLFFSEKSYSQASEEIGIPLITNYPTSEYGGNGQVWAIIQSNDQLMYFGTSTEIMEFDGINWRQIRIPDYPTGVSTRGLVMDDEGVIFYASGGSFGYLKRNEFGNREAESLKYLIPEDKRDFEEIWSAHYDGEFLYFQSREYLFRLSYDLSAGEFELKTYPAYSTFSLGYIIHGEYIIHDIKTGLHKMVDGELELIEGSEVLAGDRMFTVVPHSDNPVTGKKQFLAGRFYQDFYKYDGEKFEIFESELNQYTKTNLLYKSALLSNGNLVASIIGMGLVVASPEGKLLNILSADQGLQDPSVYSVFVDQDQTVWVGLDNGISKLQLNSPISTFTKNQGVNSTIYAITRAGGQLYISSSIGLYNYDAATKKFIPIPELGNIQIWNLVVDGDDLLVPGEVFSMIRDGRILPIDPNTSGGQDLMISPSNPNLLYISIPGGLRIFTRKGDFWEKFVDLEGMPNTIWTIAESVDGTIWGGTQTNMAYRITPAYDENGLPKVIDYKIKIFGVEEGLVNSPGYLGAIDGEIFFPSFGASLRYDPKTETIVPDDRFGMIPDNLGLTDGFFMKEDSQGQVWIPIGNKLRLATPDPDKTYIIEENLFNDYPYQSVNGLYSEEDGIVWIGSGQGLLRYDRSVSSIPKTNFPVMMRGVFAGSDTLNHLTQGIDDDLVDLPYSQNSLRFTYAAQFFQQEQRTTYQTFLEGFESDWTDWNRSSYKEYTNLSWGTYTFRVRAKNVFNEIGEEVMYTFVISPPWYATWWAYLSYLLLFGLLVALISRTQQAKVINKERQHAALREATLKAEAENDRRKNIELISEIGKDITSSLSIENIIDTVYLHVNKLMDASVFGIGIYNRSDKTLLFPATKEKGSVLPPYSYSLEDKNRLANWCFKNQKEILSNDFENDYQLYVEYIQATAAGEDTQSIVYLPLINKGKIIGVLTAQSFSKNAYTDFHQDILRSIANYAALALDNAEAYRNLKITQSQLIQSEKMASLGELTAGIAHEIQNPLNFVNNFSEVSNELIDEMNEEITKGDFKEVKFIAADIKQNLEKINHHGKRADAIVKGMLQHSRSSAGKKEPTNINALADEYLRLAYHGLRAKDKTFNATLETDFDKNIEPVNTIPQDLGRVILNLITNAFYAVNEKKQNDAKFKPIVSVSTKKTGGHLEITVSDNGNGIPNKVIDKIFQPFFTTKPTGQGTGLGLSLSYDIVKAHGGILNVESKEGKGCVFKISLPIESN
ncbi:ATP-binding protein [Maribacter sp. ACAM166]|uniref:ATP-binding protein n=1 Tax=Maribacter sp. ACAM166 TaxID=2508996 RepID=UPI0010FDB799|nr:ATP-binding protein [Maribacter sp. ACAM166]TLP80252.1 GHKL domain-containing protein [Maribacter sp. ACAM166]